MGDESGQQRRPRAPVFFSSRLSEQDKRAVSSVITSDHRKNKAVVMVTAQLYRGDAGDLSLVGTGVMCMVKEPARRWFTLRFVDVEEEQELFCMNLYLDLRLDRSRADPTTLRFRDETGCAMQLTCTEENDARELRHRVNKKLKRERLNKASSTDAGVIAGGRSNSSLSSRSSSTSDRTRQQPRRRDSATQGTARSSRPRIDKSLIGSPTNFRHLGHIGLDADGNFDATNIPSEWTELLEKAGIAREQLEDEDTRNFVENFVRNAGGIPPAPSKASTTPSAPPLPQASTSSRSRPSPPPSTASVQPPPSIQRTATPSAPPDPATQDEELELVLRASKLEHEKEQLERRLKAMEEQQQELERITGASSCPVCLSGSSEDVELDHALVPCGHLYCSTCAERLHQTSGRCAVCRMQVEQVLKTFR